MSNSLLATASLGDVWEDAESPASNDGELWCRRLQEKTPFSAGTATDGFEVLVAYPFSLDTAARLEGAERICYNPELRGCSTSLAEALESLKPRVLIVGNNKVARRALEKWRQEIPSAPLAVVRRGSSLAAIDMLAAHELSIDVVNTPGVNSPFVGQYAAESLFTRGDDATKLSRHHSGTPKLAVVGCGRVGAVVAKHGLAVGCNVTVYSPTLADQTSRAMRLGHLRLYGAGTKVRCVSTVAAAFEGATHVAITAALVRREEGPNASEGMITKWHIHQLPAGARLVSISEPEIFTDDALKEMIARAQSGHLSAHLDNAQRLMEEIRQEHPELDQWVDVTSDAMNSPECQQAMDNGALREAFAWLGSSS